MDDMRADQMEFMPVTQSFFEQSGVVFEDSIVSFSECCPSRATAFSGQYAHNHGVLSGDLPSGGVTRYDETNSLPVWLDEAGYETMLVGKYLNGYGDHDEPDVPEGWDDWFGLIDPATLFWYESEVSDNGVPRRFGVDEHRTHKLRERAVADIERAALGDDPFFLWFAPAAPHIGFENQAAGELGTGIFGPNARPRGLLPTAGWFPPPERVGALDGFEWEVPETFGVINQGAEPRLAQASELPLDQIPDVAEDYQRFAETLLGVDDAVAEILATLERTGELENTIVLFSSDNGFYFGEHRIVYAKYWPYEEGLQVPLMIRGPGFEAGRVAVPVANIDWAPTIAAAAGVTPGRVVDGVALQTVIANPEEFVDRAILLESGPAFGRSVYAGVRVAEAKFFIYRDGHEELYDLNLDPNETVNLSRAPGFEDLGTTLALLTGALRNCAGDDCRNPVPSTDAAPIAIIDPPVAMREGTLLGLSGAGSFDPDGGVLTYRWEQLSGPASSVIGQNQSDLLGIGVAAPATFELVVIDDEGDTGRTVITLVPESIESAPIDE